MNGQTSFSLKQIRTMLRKIAGQYNADIVEVYTATVTAVNGRTCDVTPISSRADTTVEGVYLCVEENDGELKTPAIGSSVLVGTSSMNDSYVIGWSDLDEYLLVIGSTKFKVINGEIDLGDGSFGGLIKINSLVTDLNNQLSALKAAITSAYSAQAGFDGSAGLNAWNVAKTGILDLQTASIENTNIKHGNV
jgi:hypothetical protein